MKWQENVRFILPSARTTKTKRKIPQSRKSGSVLFTNFTKSDSLEIEGSSAKVNMEGMIIGINPSRTGPSSVYTIEIMDYKDDWYEYLQILYDRIPTLPQSLQRDYGIIRHLLKNIAHRILR